MKPTKQNTSSTLNIHTDDFQRYLFNLSSFFLAIPATKIAAEIDTRLKEIVDFLDFNQVYLTQLSDDKRTLTTVNSYSVERDVVNTPIIETSKVPWLMQVLRNGQPKAMTRVLDEIPPEKVHDRQEIKWLGIKSALILPLVVGGEVRGGLFINNVREYRDYPEEQIKDLHYFSQTLAGALERQKAYEGSQRAMRFDRLLSEISATYINLPANKIIKSIHKDLGKLGRFLQVSRCIFYLAGEKPGSYQIDDRFGWWSEEDASNVKMSQGWMKDNPNYIDSYQYCFEKWNRGEVVQYKKIDELPPEASPLRKIHEKFGNLSWFSVPVSMGGSIVGAFVVATTHEHRNWPNHLAPRLRLFGEIFANAIKRKEQDESLKNAFNEIHNLKRQVEADYVYLQDELTLEHNYEDIIGESDGIKSVLLKVEQVAPTDVNVLVIGETGTGKELIARAIHYRSKRSARPLIKVNCAALAPSLIESELFGHEKGAFTGADKRRIGRFELAHGASLFLDEIGELSLELQPKLLRVLQEGEFERIGGSKTIKVDVRIIAATNRDLKKLVKEGRFRSDLWYRLNSFPISLPPLRERQEDIPLFVNHFINHYCSKVGKRFNKISRNVIEQLCRYSWPGNVREMDNIISRAVIISDEGKLQVQLPDTPRDEHSGQKTFREMEKQFLLQTLEDVGWKIEGVKGAAERLDLKPSTLRNRMKRLKISKPTS